MRLYKLYVILQIRSERKIFQHKFMRQDINYHHFASLRNIIYILQMLKFIIKKIKKIYGKWKK